MNKILLGWVAISIFIVTSCTNKEKQIEQTKDDEVNLEQIYLEKGVEVTGLVFQHLSGKLKSALTTGGVAGAVEFCNLAASPMVDSLSQVYQVAIKRTSHRLRNPENRPSPDESKMLKTYLSMVEGGELPIPKVEMEDTKVHYYAPIFLMETCLRCHGMKDQEIAASDYETIKNLYPGDEAYGFKVGELRGIWSLSFDRDQ